MPLINKIIKRLRRELSFRFGMFTDADLIRGKVEQRRHDRQPVLLNLGCGNRVHPDWINIDFLGDGKRVAAWDLRKRIPLPDRRCDAIYASHVIEHFSRPDAKRFLSECHRLLQPGGRIRLVAPDLEAIARAYLAALDAARRNEPGAKGRYDWMAIEMLDQLVRHQSGGEMMKYWSQDNVPEEAFVEERVGAEYRHARTMCRGMAFDDRLIPDAAAIGKFRLGGEVHLWMYDDYSLCRLLEECGFVKPVRCLASESGIAGFSRYCLDTEADGAIYKPDSFFVEASAS